MIRTTRLLPFLICFLSACREEQHAPPPVVVADPVQPGTPLRFTGQITLEGALAESRAGVIEVSVRNAGDPRPILSRRYSADDPWRVGSTLAFGLSKDDAVSNPMPTLGREMELVVRFDADGDPKTRSSLDREVVQRVPTGSTDVVVRIVPSSTVSTQTVSTQTATK